MINETFIYNIRKTFKWIWIPFLIAVLFAVSYIIYQKPKSVEKILEPEKTREEKWLIDTYDGHWEKYPEAYRYAIYNIEIQDDLFISDDLLSTPFSFLDQYNNLLVQNIMFVDNMNNIYQALINRYESLFPKVKIDLLGEMLSVSVQDHSTLIVQGSAPLSLILDDDGEPLENAIYSDEDLCDMRDYAFSLLVDIIENNNYIKKFPIKLVRSSKIGEESMSEQALIDKYIMEDMKEDVAIKYNVHENNVSTKKLLAISVLSFAISYCAIFIVITFNGKIKTGEELREITNLAVYDDLLYKDYYEAIQSVAVKLNIKQIPDKLYFVTLGNDYDNEQKIANDLCSQMTSYGKNKFIINTIAWNNDINLEIIEQLKNEQYLVYIQQNFTKISEIKMLAKELSQVNSISFGAIIGK